LWIGLLLIFCCAHFLGAQSADSSASWKSSQATPADIAGVGGWNSFSSDLYRTGMHTAMRGGRFNSGGTNLESRFEMGSKLSQDLDKGLGAGNTGALGTALGVLPKLTQWERNGLKLPVDSSLGKFQFAYRDQLGKGADAMGGGIGRGTAGATFNSTGLRDDMMRFSATAMFGGAGGGMGSGGGGSFGATASGGAGGDANGMFSLGSMNGAGIGSGSSFGGGSMHGGMGGESGHGHGAENGPSVSLKLTFK
jgi:hypothetical protein